MFQGQVGIWNSAVGPDNAAWESSYEGPHPKHPRTTQRWLQMKTKRKLVCCHSLGLHKMRNSRLTLTEQQGRCWAVTLLLLLQSKTTLAFSAAFGLWSTQTPRSFSLGWLPSHILCI